MIELFAALKSDEEPLVHLHDAETVARIKQSPEWQIREGSFLARVQFRVGDLVLSRRREPVLDFGLSLRSNLDLLALERRTELSFQGTSDRVRFTLTENRVEIRANYAEGIAYCSYVDLLCSVLSYMRNSLDVLTAKAPDLLESTYIEYLYREFLVREMGEEQFRRHSQAMAKIYGAGQDS
ncbi:hypothetical protein ACQP2Y_37355 [Actinoplanes sp. CA-051413]|uniref:hypothetical protein n=1 Tax=Actinoplanes sp. CA-051413 TaxID=3239899 RepID=UPI003D994166